MDLDLHTHTRYSFDSRNDPAAVIRIAKSRGLGGMAITDHNTFAGAAAVMAIAPPDFLVIPGIEVGTRCGDILALFVKEDIKTKDPYEVVDAIHEQGGVAVLAHPFARMLSIDKKLAEKIDGCEAFNARYGKASLNAGGDGIPYVVALAREYDLTMTGGSDAHFTWEIGRGRTIVQATTLAEVKAALLNGDTQYGGEVSSIANPCSPAFHNIL